MDVEENAHTMCAVGASNAGPTDPVPGGQCTPLAVCEADFPAGVCCRPRKRVQLLRSPA